MPLMTSADTPAAAGEMGLIALSLCKEYPTRGEPLSVLRDVSLTLHAGQSAVIMGPSGSGKSTLLSILGALEPPTRGDVTLDGVNPFRIGEAELARFRNRRVGFVFQEHYLLPQCSVLENVLVPTLADRPADDPTPRAIELLERVGLNGRLEHLPAELSGGERQRAAIARAMMNRPALLLADEPTGNLDRRTAEVVADLLLEMHRAERTILVCATHSVALAGRFERRFEITDGGLDQADAAKLS